MDNLGNLVRRWQLGWAAARGFAPAVEERGGLHVPVGEESRNVEIVVLDADAVAALAFEVAGSAENNWLTVPTNDDDAVRSAFRDAGLELIREECLMSTDLGEHPVVAPAESYAVSTSADGPVLTTRIEHSSGELAAHGVMTVIGTDAVAHAINTEPGHRRRGLASALMSALVNEAVARGAKTGILVASAEGELLYQRLGWQRDASVLVARR
jgi:GNAT superfamily N-acetyltransferase